MAVVDWIIALLVLPIGAYLVGSIPFGYLVGRLKGIDISQHGSKNIGATNVARVLGRKLGYTVFALDVLKGAVPVALAGLWLHHSSAPASLAGPAMLGLWLLTAFAAIIGHIFPVWLRFRGGKGVATSLGVVLAIFPFFTLPGLIALTVWVVFALIWRYVSLASIAAAVAFPAALLVMSLVFGGAWAPARIWPLLAFAVAMPLLVILRHRTNVARLIAGTESKIGQRKCSSS
jgi:glycerol-3-phosphate acyltransferase PlsY